MVKYRPLLVTAITLGLCLPVAAQQAGGTKVGVLTCNTSASPAIDPVSEDFLLWISATNRGEHRLS
jgi:hypothetical protein